MHLLAHQFYTKAFFRNPIFFLGTLSVLISHVLIWAVLFRQFTVVYQPESEFITLHYKVFVGVDLTSAWYAIFALPAFGLAVFILNYALSRRFYHANQFLMPFLIAMAAGTQLVLAAALWLIIQVNIY